MFRRQEANDGDVMLLSCCEEVGRKDRQLQALHHRRRRGHNNERFSSGAVSSESEAEDMMFRGKTGRSLSSFPRLVFCLHSDTAADSYMSAA